MWSPQCGLSKSNLAKKEQEIRDLKEKLEQTLVEISNSESNPAQNIPEQCKRMTTKELSESTTGHSEDSIHSPYDYIEIFESRAIDIQRDASGFYQCDQCEYNSQFKKYLDNHYRIHTGEESFGCKLCKQRFKVKSLH